MSINLQMSDLIKQCQKCEGTGHILPPKEPRTAFGMGPVTWNGECEDCDGLGGSLTETGELLRKFISKLKGAGKF